MKLREIKNVFLLGIGGVGMSGLARYFRYQGLIVMGYDRASTPLTQEMEAEGIQIFYEDNENLIPQIFHQKGDSKLVIFTPSIPGNNQVRIFLEKKGFELVKRSRVLGQICEGLKVIGVGGTHGKTTTSCMISHLLKTGGIDCYSFLGGISTNYKTNFLPGSSPYAVVEADEFDRSFLTLFPEMAVITSMDADHLDIYGTLENMILAFNEFISQVKPNGFILTKAGLSIERPHLQYQIVYQGKPIFKEIIRAENIRIKGDLFVFDYAFGRRKIKNLRLSTPGYHNIENAVAAITIAIKLGLDSKKITKGLESFTGVKRRFEYIYKGINQIYIDDYAHHQDELKAFLTTVRLLYPKKYITVIFQPHLFTRTRDFYKEMGDSLSLADELYLMEIYPAREEPLAGISSQIILDQVRLGRKFILNQNEILQRLKALPTEVVLTVGAGDIDRLVMPIKEILTAKDQILPGNPISPSGEKGESLL